jgi:hypothetical protein
MSAKHMRYVRAVVVSMIAAASGGSAGCSGSSDTGGNVTPVTLASTCGSICSNALSQCQIAATAYGDCNDACNALLFAPDTCITEFASYLACLVDVTVTCDPAGATFTIAPGACQSQEDTFESCNAGPSAVSACLAVPSSSTACTTNAGEGLTSSAGTPEFCVGVPSNCTAPSANPLGIGTYCCP